MHDSLRSFPEITKKPSADERRAVPIILGSLGISALCLIADCTQRPAIEIAIENNQSAIAATIKECGVTEESAGTIKEQNGISSATTEGVVRIDSRKKIAGGRRGCIESVIDEMPNQDVAYELKFGEPSLETRDCTTTHSVIGANPEEFTILSKTVCPKRVNPFTRYL